MPREVSAFLSCTEIHHVSDFDHRIDWDNAKILKSEPHAYRRRVGESFLIHQKVRLCNVINRNDGANFSIVYGQ